MKKKEKKRIKNKSLSVVAVVLGLLVFFFPQFKPLINLTMITLNIKKKYRKFKWLIYTEHLPAGCMYQLDLVF